MRPPKLAQWLLARFGVDDALTGDLVERYSTGRSRNWYWQQAIAAILTAAIRDLRDHTLVAVRAVAIGWAVLLFVFSFGDLLTPKITHWVWNWTLVHGYDGLRIWWIQHGMFIPTTLAGFLISGWAVARMNRSMPAMSILIFATSVLLATSSAAAVIAWIDRPTPVPHTFFYVIWLVLPFVWRVGLAILPMLVLVGGLLGAHPQPKRLLA